MLAYSVSGSLHCASETEAYDMAGCGRQVTLQKLLYEERLLQDESHIVERVVPPLQTLANMMLAWTCAASWQITNTVPYVSTCSSSSRRNSASRIRCQRFKERSKEAKNTGPNDVHEPAVTGNGLSHTYDGISKQFEGIDVFLSRGSKSGLVGVNGAGKSTLLKVIAGIDKPSEGSLVVSRALRMAYVEQDPVLPAGASASDFIFKMDTPAVRALRDYNKVMAAGSGADSKELTQALADMETHNAWLLEEQMTKMSASLRVDHLLDKPAELLSGGERKRVALAAALLENPDLLLLDEPTNHLDIDVIRWLEDELKSRSKLTTLVVTHDRSFLGSVCDDILELDRAAMHVHRYCLDYDDFLVKKAERLEVEAQQAASDKTKLKKELEWVRKQPQARQTKSKKREADYEVLDAKVVASKHSANIVSSQFSVGNNKMQRLGSKVLSLNKATVAVAGRNLLTGFSFDIAKGDRIGIAGANGAGKSSLLKALIGEVPLAAGELVRGDTVVVGYYRQEGLTVPPDAMLIDLVKEAVDQSPGGGKNPDADESKAYSLLKKFLFPENRWRSPAKLMSGGEQRRLQLLRVLAMQPNVLLLDEPTNDLDLQTMSVLEDYVQSFAGAVIVVSHDRYFLDRVCTKLLVLPGAGKEPVEYIGTFSQYLLWRDETLIMEEEEEEELPAIAEKAASPSSQSEALPVKKKLSNVEFKEMRKLESTVDKLSKKRDKLQEGILNIDPNDWELLQKKNEELAALTEEIETTEEKWMEYAERA